MMWLVLGAFLLLVVSGAAVAYALGAASVLSFIATDNSRYLAILPQNFFSQIDVFALMAMPLFILAGEIMNRAGTGSEEYQDLSKAIATGVIEPD